MNFQAIASSKETRFGFGKNWLDYSKYINEERISEAVKSLQRFFEPEDCADKTFLDIGCGSGLFSLAALKLGFKKVLAIDLDPDSVQATTSLLSHHASRDQWECKEFSVFDLDPKTVGQFDVVYSWGVLHHTGDMRKAINIASQMVKSNGLFVLALYRKTLMCNFWTWEKRTYNNRPKWFPFIARTVYKALFILQRLIRGRSVRDYIYQYQKNRGMNWHHDVVDWLGGYPYESISPSELKVFADYLGFEIIKAFTKKQTVGLLGSGCDEFCLKKLT